MRRNTLIAVSILMGCSSPPVSPVVSPVASVAAVPAASVSAAAPGAERPRRPQLVAGDDHACFLDANGGLLCWGRNRGGSVGDGTKEPRSAPVRVAIPEAIAVAAGDRDTCAVVAGGQVRCWGAEYSPLPTEIAGIVDAETVAVGQWHACALRRSGKVSCWGFNARGQLGIGATSKGQHPPRDVPGVEDAVGIAAGAQASCAVERSGKVVCWGTDGERRSLTPLAVPGLPAMRAVRMREYQTCGIAADGRVFCWGDYVKLEGAPSPEPVAVGGWSGVVDLAVGVDDRCAILGDGEVSCMGYGKGFGRVGAELPTLMPPVVVRAAGYLQAKASAVATGLRFTCILDTSGSVSCVGSNASGELGIGETGHFRAPPGEVPGVDGAVAVVPARWSACALRKDGEVVCWGTGDSTGMLHLQLGYPASRALPAEPVPDLPSVRALFPGMDASSLCAVVAASTRRAPGRPVTKEGDVYCFWAGLDGPSPGAPRPPARRVAGLGGVVDLAFSADHRVGYAVLRSGSVVAFQGKQEQRDPRVMEVRKATIAGLSGVAQIVALSHVACARRTNGSVVCFKTAPLFDDETGSARRSGEPRPAIAATNPSLVVVKDVADVVDLGKADENADFVAARTRRGEVFLIRADTGFRAVAQPGLQGAVAMSHHGKFFAVMPDGAVVSPESRNGGTSLGDDGVWELHRREDLGPAVAVESDGNTCIVRPSGKVGCWGSNEGGACGRMDRVFSSELLPVKLPAN